MLRVPASGTQRGQASAELVAAIPLVVVAVLAVAQAVVAGYALWSAGTAARAGARADHVGGDPHAAARSALPEPLRAGSRITISGPVTVRVAAPRLVPGLSGLEVAASAELDPDPRDG